MTNEEIIEAIQTGQQDQRELYSMLWDGVKGLVYLRAVAKVNQEDRPADLEDLMQESFLMLPEAVGSFDPSRGSFTSYFVAFFAPRAFVRALYDSTGVSGFKKPLFNSISIDAPLSNQYDEITVQDSIADETAELAFVAIDNDSFWRDARRFLWNAVNKLPPKHRIVITAVFHWDKTLIDVHREKLIGDVSYSRVSATYREALKKLQTYITHVARSEAESIGLFDEIGSLYVRGGLDSFRSTGSSAVERIVIKHDERNRRLCDLTDLLTVTGNRYNVF